MPPPHRHDRRAGPDRARIQRRSGDGFEHQKFDLDERTKVQLRLCYTNNGRNVRCTGWQRAEA